METPKEAQAAVYSTFFAGRTEKLMRHLGFMSGDRKRIFIMGMYWRGGINMKFMEMV
jgi:hypothetical protein